MRLIRKAPLLSAALAVSLVAMGAAADTTATTDATTSASLPGLSDTTSTTSAAAAKTTAATDTTATTATNTASTTGSSDTTQTTASTTTGTTSGSKVTITGSQSTSTVSAPSITGSAAASSDAGLTGLPTLTGAYKIVAPSVPPTANAPYMQNSTLPEGTVFIAVGAILGFMALCVVLWRGLVAWSLHRSVKRAALAQHAAMADAKPLFKNPGAPGPPPAPFYKYTDRESTISLSGLGGHKNRKSLRPSSASAAAGANLFFSPTAGAAVAGLANPGNRGSSYLPAGYYAAGASSPGGGTGHVSVGGHGPAISLSNLGPQAGGYPRTMSVASGPDSPYLTPNRGHMASSSTLNLNTAYAGERAPSAYLDDLFDGEGGPPVPGNHRRIGSGGPGRF